MKNALANQSAGPIKEHVLVLRPSFGSLARVTLRLVRYCRGGVLAHHRPRLGSPGHRLGTRGLLAPPLCRQARFFVVANYQSTVWRSQAFAEKSTPAPAEAIAPWAVPITHSTCLFGFAAIPSLREVCGGSGSLRETPQRPRRVSTPQAERKGAHCVARNNACLSERFLGSCPCILKMILRIAKRGASVTTHSVNAQVAARSNSNAGKSILQQQERMESSRA